MLDGALALPEYIIEFDISPEMGKVRRERGPTYYCSTATTTHCQSLRKG